MIKEILKLPDVPRTESLSVNNFFNVLKRSHERLAGKKSWKERIPTLGELVQLGVITETQAKEIL